MSTLAELALLEATLKTLGDKISDRLKTVKADMQLQLDAQGIDRVGATLPDGTKVANVSATGGATNAVVVDDAAFLAWVRKTSPDNVSSRVVTAIRPAYVKTLLTAMNKAAGPVWTDTATGEIHDVPGVEMQTTGKSHSLNTLDRDAVAAAWRAGALAHLDLLQLTAGDES